MVQLLETIRNNFKPCIYLWIYLTIYYCYYYYYHFSSELSLCVIPCWLSIYTHSNSKTFYSSNGNMVHLEIAYDAVRNAAKYPCSLNKCVKYVWLLKISWKQRQLFNKSNLNSALKKIGYTYLKQLRHEMVYIFQNILPKALKSAVLLTLLRKSGYLKTWIKEKKYNLVSYGSCHCPKFNDIISTTKVETKLKIEYPSLLLAYQNEDL